MPVPIYDLSVSSDVGESFHIMLMSDLHVGCPHTDIERIKRDLKWARKHNAPILINGDLFEAITPRDPRFSSSSLRKEDAGRSSLTNYWIEEADKLLWPYFDLIYLVGSGNHETAVLKHTSNDMTATLLDKWEERCRGTDMEYNVINGGYEGVVRIRVKTGVGKTRTLTLWFHHGFGGSSPVTKGIIGFNRWRTWAKANVLWCGHTHNKMAVPDVVEVIPQSGSSTIREEQYFVMTAAYKIDGQTFDDSGRHQQSWGREKNFAPQPLGGTMMRLDVTEESRKGQYRNRLFVRPTFEVRG